jgi:hypothetical protein
MVQYRPMIQNTIEKELDAIADPAIKGLVGGILHEIFLTLMLEQAREVCDPVKKAAAQEVLASALEAVRSYDTHKQRSFARKPVVAMTAPPPNKP